MNKCIRYDKHGVKFIGYIFTDSGVILEKVGRNKNIVRTEEEIKKMTTKEYLDELVVPVLNKALLKVNKEVSTLIQK